MSQQFDFVVVGGGTAGCLLASRLASTPSRPIIALLEGGPDINKAEYRRTADRFSNLFTLPNLDYGYVSTPQEHARNRQIPLARGKGLGGSSALNFQVWSVAAREEFDAWAEAAGDAAWGFDSVIERVKQLENLSLAGLGKEWDGYMKPDPKHHGSSGPINLSFGHVEQEVKTFIDAGVELGHKANVDPNDGDLIGFSLNPTTSLDGVRVTSASAFLGTGLPDNLTVRTESRVVKILFEGDRAVGVLTEDGTRVTARKEVIVSAGAIDSPRLLLLSGVGPKSDLKSLGIHVVKDLDGVGKSFTDRAMTATWFEMKPGFTERTKLLAPGKYEEAVHEFQETGAGPLMQHYSSSPHAFLKGDRAYNSPEFKKLPRDIQDFLLKPGVPSYELAPGSAPHPTHAIDYPNDLFYNVIIATHNPLSRGQIRLSSADPRDHPLVDPNYLSHPYDAVNLREGVRESMKLMQTPSMQEYCVKPILAPKSDNDDDIMKFIEGSVAGLWHHACSVKMGKSEADGSCVDGNLKVHGLKGLRVADLSVAPQLPSGHPVSAAYVIGQLAAEKIRQEYGL